MLVAQHSKRETSPSTYLLILIKVQVAGETLLCGAQSVEAGGATLDEAGTQGTALQDKEATHKTHGRH